LLQLKANHPAIAGVRLRSALSGSCVGYSPDARLHDRMSAAPAVPVKLLVTVASKAMDPVSALKIPEYKTSSIRI
jgi:hypothetical protein